MVEVYAHRGLHANERENTLGAFGSAVALGVDGVELDVRRTLDGALVVHHDPVIDGLAIATATRGDLPEYVPDLSEAMAQLTGVRVNVEIKNIRDSSEPTYDSTGEFARQVLSELDQGGWLETVLISCFDLATCAAVRGGDREVPVGWLLWGEDLSSALIRARAVGLSAVNPYFSTVSPESVAQANELGLDLNVWTVNAPSDLRAMIDLGVRSVITDQPALALEIRDQRP